MGCALAEVITCTCPPNDIAVVVVGLSGEVSSGSAVRCRKKIAYLRAESSCSRMKVRAKVRPQKLVPVSERQSPPASKPPDLSFSTFSFPEKAMQNEATRMEAFIVEAEIALALQTLATYRRWFSHWRRRGVGVNDLLNMTWIWCQRKSYRE